MSFIIDYDELNKLLKGELTIEDLTKPENIALLTWSGDDVKYMLKTLKKKDVEIDDGIVNDIVHRMGEIGIGEYLTYAVKDYLRDTDEMGSNNRDTTPN